MFEMYFIANGFRSRNLKQVASIMCRVIGHSTQKENDGTFVKQTARVTN